MDFTTNTAYSQVSISHYSSNELGIGSFGTVFTAVGTNNEEYACKVSELDYGNSLRNFVREVVILSSLNHPNIVKLKDIASSSAGSRGYMILEKMEGDLTKLLADSTGRELLKTSLKSVFHQILSGLAALHWYGYSHRDVKTENILYNYSKHNSGQLKVKIADFGMARNMETDEEYFSKDVCSPIFRSPEIWKSLNQCSENIIPKDRRMYDTKVDIYSAGIVFVDILLAVYNIGQSIEGCVGDKIVIKNEIRGRNILEFISKNDGNPIDHHNLMNYSHETTFIDKAWYRRRINRLGSKDDIT
jgi:serine/threonine protein kinase